METLVLWVRICSHYIGKEFGTEKCAMLIMKSGKRHMMAGKELLIEEKIRTLWEKENQQIPSDIGSLHHQTSRDDRKYEKEYPGRTRKLLETKI